jgi:hypothetical protein
VNKLSRKTNIRQRQFSAVKKVLLFLGLSIAALLYLQFGITAARIGIWSQAIPVIVASLSLAAGAYKISQDQRAARIVFWGTLPAWLFHIAATFIVTDESPIFAVFTGIAPIISVAKLLLDRRR